jgi:hypothetical protein
MRNLAILLDILYSIAVFKLSVYEPEYMSFPRSHGRIRLGPAVKPTVCEHRTP